MRGKVRATINVIHICKRENLFFDNVRHFVF